TLFLRRTFELTDASSVVALQANVSYDDGFIAWLNGVEVLRINVAGQRGDPVAYTGTAAATREPGKPQNVEVLDARPLLVTGTTLLAVEVFTVSKKAADLPFDLELFDPFGPDLKPPAIELLVPGPGASIRRLSQVDVTFDEEVTGVDAGDLLVNGAPAAA